MTISAQIHKCSLQAGIHGKIGTFLCKIVDYFYSHHPVAASRENLHCYNSYNRELKQQKGK